MTEETLNYLAMTVELSVPIVVLAASYMSVRFRKYGVVLLGACSVWLLIYAAIMAGHWLGYPSTGYAYEAMWLMSFLPYVATITVVGILSLAISRFGSAWVRFTAGAMPPVLLVAGLLAGGQ